MIVDGREIAARVIEVLKEEREHSADGPLSLGILMMGGDAVTESFIKIKSKAAQELGVEVVRRELDQNATTDDAIAAVADLHARVTGIIVQLPLPAIIDTEKVLAALGPAKDVDAVGPKPHVLLAPVAGAVREVLASTNTPVAGKKVVVVGAGRLVGKPVAEMLTQMGANVSFVTEQAGSLEELKSADIAVLGTGNSGFIKPEMLKPGIVLIDAGTTEAASGKIMGDADPACANMASVFTPVPGGIGPIAVSMIFKNLFELAKHHALQEKK
jgi:methylenetetrahydrofolate dehydrogenase (NADP+)/methenyltetrahydrofolate cyclohydrolase